MDTITREREELLERVHALPFCMYLTCLSSEGCLEVDVVSAKGTAYSWESIDDFAFYAYCLNGLSKNKIALIKEHILSKSFYLEDLNRTQLKKIIPTKDKTKDLSEMFEGFLELPDDKIESLYCYINIDTGIIYVSDDQEKLSNVINDQYPVDTLWEEMSDDTLKDYLEEYEGNECEIPFSYFD